MLQAVVAVGLGQLSKATEPHHHKQQGLHLQALLFGIATNQGSASSSSLSRTGGIRSSFVMCMNISVLDAT